VVRGGEAPPGGLEQGPREQVSDEDDEEEGD
jgi:hypothetical protein